MTIALAVVGFPLYGVVFNCINANNGQKVDYSKAGQSVVLELP